jgi:hypothetical protein
VAAVGLVVAGNLAFVVVVVAADVHIQVHVGVAAATFFVGCANVDAFKNKKI